MENRRGIVLICKMGCLCENKHTAMTYLYLFSDYLNAGKIKESKAFPQTQKWTVFVETRQTGAGVSLGEVSLKPNSLIKQRGKSKKCDKFTESFCSYYRLKRANNLNSETIWRSRLNATWCSSEHLEQQVSLWGNEWRERVLNVSYALIFWGRQQSFLTRRYGIVSK